MPIRPEDVPTRLTEIQSSGICAARAQIEAARLRMQRLIGSGRLGRTVIDAGLPKKSLPGYELLRELHRGGQGVVYLAVQESTGREVAVKVLHGATCDAHAAQGLARFEREVEILSRLKHPNVVTIHDCGRDQDDVFLVMDYVSGCRLDALAAGRPEQLPGTLDLFARVCDGVNAAHLRGIIHRDLKPGNILIDEHGEPRVLDFGLAKLTYDGASSSSAGESMTVAGQFVGSLPWASPEQAEGRTELLDIRSDVYSLGVVLYQLLTGRFPYTVTGRHDDVVRQIVQADPTRPSTIQPAIDRELETILLKCLAKEPERRYQSAGELARDLRRYLAREPIEARRDSLAYVMTKQLARYRAVLGVAALLMLAGLCALIVSLNFWRQAEEQRTRAELSAALAQASADRADREAASARAITDFMREVLTSVEPENQGADVRLIDVLANASQAVEQRFAGRPLQEAQVRELLGQVHDTLGLWQEAEAEFRAALSLWRAHAGRDDPRTLVAEGRLAGIGLNLSKFREVEGTLLELTPRMSRILGPDDRNTLAARRSLAIALLHQRRLNEAEAILLELRAHAALQADDEMQMRIAQSLVDLLHWRRAEPLSSEERSLSLEREQTLAQEWFERSNRCYSPRSAITLQAQLILAEITCEQGEFASAVDQCRALLSNTEGRLPDCHEVRAWALAVLANALARLGENEEPAELYLRRIECLRQGGAPARVALLSSISDALAFLERAGRAAEGEALARELCEAMRKYGDQAALTGEICLAGFVSAQRRLEEAEAAFAELLSREAQWRDRAARARLHGLYGRHLTRCGRYPEAEQSLDCAVSWVDHVGQSAIVTHPDDLILAYIELYQAWGKLDRVAEYQQLLPQP